MAATKLDPDALSELVLSIFNVIEPGAADQIQQEMWNELGIDFRGDIVKTLVAAYLDEHLRLNRTPHAYEFFDEQTKLL